MFYIMIKLTVHVWYYTHCPKNTLKLSIRTEPVIDGAGAGLGICSLVFRANRLFLPKNERMSNSLKKTSDSLICSFLVSDLSDSLMITHFLWATWANCSWSLIFGERPERLAHIAHFWWATSAIRSHRSPKKREWAICSFPLFCLFMWGPGRIF